VTTIEKLIYKPVDKGFMDTSILEDIGLTGAEIKVFLTLLELGSSQAGKVVEKSGLQNAVVHRAFHSLAEKGLITFALEGKKKSYQSIEPKLLLNFIDEKKAKLEQLLPELEAKKALQKEFPKAVIFQGIKGIKELINSMLETEEKNYCAYGAPIRSNELLGDFFWKNFHDRRIKKRIAARLIFQYSLKKWGEELNSKKFTDVKYTIQDFEELTETIICGEKIAILIYTEKPFGFLISEKNVADSYRKFFDILWNNAKII